MVFLAFHSYGILYQYVWNDLWKLSCCLIYDLFHQGWICLLFTNGLLQGLVRHTFSSAAPSH